MGCISNCIGHAISGETFCISILLIFRLLAWIRRGVNELEIDKIRPAENEKREKK